MVAVLEDLTNCRYAAIDILDKVGEKYAIKGNTKRYLLQDGYVLTICRQFISMDWLHVPEV